MENDKASEMFYKQFISTYAREYDLSPAQATRMIESVFELLKNSVIREGVVSIRGVGRFYTKTSKRARTFNGLTGAYEELPLRKLIKFAPATSFKDGLNASVAEEIQRYSKKQATIKQELIRKGVIVRKDKRF